MASRQTTTLGVFNKYSLSRHHFLFPQPSSPSPNGHDCERIGRGCGERCSECFSKDKLLALELDSSIPYSATNQLCEAGQVTPPHLVSAKWGKWFLIRQGENISTWGLTASSQGKFWPLTILFPISPFNYIDPEWNIKRQNVLRQLHWKFKTESD